MSPYPLHEACMNGDIAKVQDLIVTSSNLKQDLIQRDLDERTPLHWATSFSHTEIITILLSHMQGIDLDTLVDEAGWTPVHIAASVGNLEILKQFVERVPRPDLDLQTKQGVTALHLAVGKRHMELVKYLLLEQHVSTRIRDSRDQIALHRAAAVGSLKLVELLCREGKSPVNWKDKKGWTPLFHALAEGHGDVGVLLVNEFGAETEIPEGNEAGEEKAGNLSALDVALNEQVKKYFLRNIEN